MAREMEKAEGSSQTAPTKGPWKVEQVDGAGPRVVGSSELLECVAYVDSSRKGSKHIRGFLPVPKRQLAEAQANAELMVEAVNAYDALGRREGLASLLKALEVDSDARLSERGRAAIDRVRSALGLAEPSGLYLEDVLEGPEVDL